MARVEELKEQITKLQAELEIEESKSAVWRPNWHDEYYCVTRVTTETWLDDEIDRKWYSLGFVCKTERERQFKVEKLKVIKELQDFATEHNEPVDWNDNTTPKYSIIYAFGSKKVTTTDSYWCKDNSIYFSSDEIAQEAIKQIGEERIKKYYLEVE